MSRRPSYSTETPRAVLTEYIGHNPDSHGGVCWDCEKPLGSRIVHACRGVMPDGRLAMFSLCLKCGEKERSEALGSEGRSYRRLGWFGLIVAALGLSWMLTVVIAGFPELIFWMFLVHLTGVLMTVPALVHLMRRKTPWKLW